MDPKKLSPEFQERLKNAKTEEELVELAEKEGLELSDEQLEAISGGWSCDSFGERSDCHLNQWYE